MNITTNKTKFNQDFDEYKLKFKNLNELYENQIGKSLRSFDVRFRLALSLQIGFDNEISYTKTENTRKTYNLIFKLNEYWFAYEGLYKLCDEVGFLKNSAKKQDPFTVEKITEFELSTSVDVFGDYLKDSIYLKPKQKEDFISYLTYLKTNSMTAQANLLSNFINKVESDTLPQFTEILSLIYAIRNLYVHNTDTAKSGVQYYSTKISILKNCNDFLILSILNISTRVLDYKIEDVE